VSEQRSEPVTDIHTHIVPASFPASISGSVPLIDVRPYCDCRRAEVFIDGKQFRTVTSDCWDMDLRLATMDRTGIDRQILSPMPELLSFWRPASDAASIATHVNECLALMTERAPARFAALGMVPLQDPDLAIRTLEEIMAHPGFVGVEIGTNIAGVSLGDSRLSPFFEAAERLNAAIFVHPVKTVLRYPVPGPPALDALAIFPCETALSATALIMSGVATAHPGLRLAFSHGGGALALLLPRLDNGWRESPAVQQTIAELPSALAKRFFYDTLVYDGETLRFLIATFGVRQLCIGTDQPFAIAEKDPVTRIRALGLSLDDRRLLLSGNAARFLGSSRR